LAPGKKSHWLRNQASSIQNPASSIKYPAAVGSWQKRALVIGCEIQYQVSRIQYPAAVGSRHQAKKSLVAKSSIQYPVSSIQYQASSIQHPVSSIRRQLAEGSNLSIPNNFNFKL
jgi:hypothetical protein